MERSIGARELKETILSIDRAASKAGIKNLRVILCGGLAAIAYGMGKRATIDIDAEVNADLETINKKYSLLGPLFIFKLLS